MSVTLDDLTSGVRSRYPIGKVSMSPEFQHFVFSRSLAQKDTGIAIPYAEVDKKGMIRVGKHMLRNHLAAKIKYTKKCSLKYWVSQLCGSEKRDVFMVVKAFEHYFPVAYSRDENVVRFCDACGNWNMTEQAEFDYFAMVVMQQVAAALYTTWKLDRVPNVFIERSPRDCISATYCNHASFILVRRAADPDSRLKLLGGPRPNPAEVESYYTDIARTDEFYSFLAANKQLLS
jgi:hypothetical protein